MKKSSSLSIISTQRKLRFNSSGQALVTLLIVIAASMVMISAAVVMAVSTSQASGLAIHSQQALMTAESGMEEALMRLLRDPNYTGGALTLDATTATISVTGANPKTVLSSAQSGTVVRKIQAQISESSGVMTVTEWKEVRE